MRFNHIDPSLTGGMITLQHKNIINKISLLYPENISVAVEIGTHNGGFSFLLSSLFEKVYTIDSVDRGQAKNLEDKTNVNVFVGDCFKREEIRDIILNNKCIVFCDGGNKIKEFNYFSRFLNPGSIIMCHDYARSKDHFKNNIKNKIWNWCEVTDKDLILNGFKRFTDVDFQTVAWGAFVKE